MRDGFGLRYRSGGGEGGERLMETEKIWMGELGGLP